MRRAAFLALLLFASSPLMVLAQTAARPAKPSFKGVELYSWKEDTTGLWRFSLLPGTNRNKTIDEITEPSQSIAEVAGLKQRIAVLAEGEKVFWMHNSAHRKLSFPRPNVVSDIIKFAADRKISVITLQ